MIVWKVALLGLTALAQISASEPVPQYQHPLVKQVTCFGSRGTAFRIGPTTMLSVAHVTDGMLCTVEGRTFQSVAEPGDFSVIQHPVSKATYLKVNCEGFKRGEYYWAVGFAGGRPTQTTVRLIGTGKVADAEGRFNGAAILYGSPTVIPGMSGGPVFNAAGEVVGTVNAFNPFEPFSLSRALRDTSVCA